MKKNIWVERRVVHVCVCGGGAWNIKSKLKKLQKAEVPAVRKLSKTDPRKKHVVDMVGHDCLSVVLQLGRGLHMNTGVLKLIPNKDMNKKEVQNDAEISELKKNHYMKRLFSYFQENFCKVMWQSAGRSSRAV